MNRTSAGVLIVVIGVAELLIVGLLLPHDRWLNQETMIALTGAIIAWSVVTGVVLGQFARRAETASALVQWPLILIAFCWAILSSLPVAFAVEMTTKWIIGLHALAGLACTVVWVMTKETGRWVDSIEVEIAETYENHSDLKNAVVEAKAKIVSSGLDTPTAQRARTVLDRTETLPRLVLDGPTGVTAVQLVRKVGLAAGEGAEKLQTTLSELSEFLVAAKRPR
ncbi:MAG: hypothetical protein HXX12_06945 [Geothrix sp.]|uniref:hypothetical protein n=1 Tax=Geothrix sp. TaxID=1962974 RepID=UPI0017EA6D9F|nr:hypothetical protein [Geothrix sp.]NWJ40691.1 hypothetical protein [Geothrix sp.]WIL21301.1 MAG: hypothetical protein QOZ81_000555 [Geothrix sp.]